MKVDEKIRKLAEMAAAEVVPHVDVAPQVMASLSLIEENDMNRSWCWIASLSGATALPILVMAYVTMDAWLDPLQDVFYMFRWVMS